MKLPQHNKSRASHNAGFALVELLITITVIATITAIAISRFADYSEQASINSAKRTAQIVAATAESARIAGDLSIYEAATVEEALDLLKAGVEGKGLFEGVVYKVSLDAKQRGNVLPFLDFEEGLLMYDATSS